MPRSRVFDDFSSGFGTASSSSFAFAFESHFFDWFGFFSSSFFLKSYGAQIRYPPSSRESNSFSTSFLAIPYPLLI
jgi:hypothetical protein